MNRVRYVPADPAARAADRTSTLTMRVGQSVARGVKRVLTAVEADRMALRRGWVRLSTLPAGERREYSKR